jgi:predicted phosphodiesterase
MSVSRFITVKSRALSLWQSAAAETARKSISQPLKADLQPPSEKAGNPAAHPMIAAAAAHAARAARLGDRGRPNLRLHSLTDSAVPDDPAEREIRLSALCFGLAEARIAGDDKLASELEREIRKFSSADLAGWATCITTYIRYRTQYSSPLYRDWKKEHQSIRTFGVINYRLPNHARVAVIGDWGTGMPDARALVRYIVEYQNPDAIIHLGDIYYSGTPEECRNAFTRVFDEVFAETGKKRIPVFTIPGNHDYYALGYGFYPEVIDVVNRDNEAWRQEASYFCLRTEDETWQILAMDTGLHDSNPVHELDPAYNGPWLEPSEAEWHRDKLLNFPGRTILMSHHQLFSRHSAIQNRLAARPWLNEHLYETFSPHFSRIAAWFWGHEHNLSMFQNGIMGLNMGRLVGASAYEETTGESPYSPKDEVFAQQVPYISDMPQLSSADGYYYHSYAILDFSRKAKDDPITCTYFEFPSWGDRPPSVIEAKAIYQEPIGISKPAPPAGEESC